MSSTSRYDDCWRESSVWSSYYNKEKKRLGREPTDFEVQEAYRQTLAGMDWGDTSQITLEKYIGEDLSESDLDDLWSHFAGEHSDTNAAYWWTDKPHQIGYRLLLRLTRAEGRIAELEKKLKEVSSDE